MLFECEMLFLRDYAGSGLCGGVRASELYAVRVLIVVPEGVRGLTPVRRRSSRGVGSLLFECGASFLRQSACSCLGWWVGVGAMDAY